MATLETLGWRSKAVMALDTTGLGDIGAASEFAIPIKIISGDIDAMFTGDFPVRSDGGDLRILVSGNTDETEILNIEIESIDISSKTATIFLLASDDINNTTQNYDVYWGNASATQPAAAATGGYEGIWTPWSLVTHQKDLTTATLLDSTGSGYTATKMSANNPLQDTGIIGKAQNYTPNDLTGYGDVLIDGATDLSVSLWAKFDDLTRDQAMLFKGAPTSDQPFAFFRDEVGSVSGRTNTFKIVVSDGPTAAAVEGATGACNDNDWKHIAVTFDGGSATGLRMYINGVEDANSPGNVSAIAALRNISQPIETGTYSGGGWWLDGMLDEIRLALNIKTAAWFRFEYELVANQSTYISWGSVIGIGNKKKTISILRYTPITATYKIKAQARVIMGGNAKTIANACRILIRKIST